MGRESFESWGKRKRRHAETELDDTLTRLSHEIIVLDIGDESQLTHGDNQDVGQLQPSYDAGNGRDFYTTSTSFA